MSTPTPAEEAAAKAMANPYNFYTQEIISLLMGNIGTTGAHANELNILTDTSEDLSAAWTALPSPTANNVYAALLTVGIPGPTGITMACFIQTYLTYPNINEFSSALNVQIMNTLANNWDPSSGSASPGQMNTINTWGSLISSTAQQQESIGQNLTKTESSVIQQDGGAQQGFADMGNSVCGISGNFASLLQQSY